MFLFNNIMRAKLVPAILDFSDLAVSGLASGPGSECLAPIFRISQTTPYYTIQRTFGDTGNS